MNRSLFSSKFKPPARPRSGNFFLSAIPWMVALLAGTYGLSYLTQVRYDMHDKKKTVLKKEDELRLKKERKPFNIQEEYFRLAKDVVDNDDWDMVRVPRAEERKKK